jgi:hypothetical protein
MSSGRHKEENPEANVLRIWEKSTPRHTACAETDRLLPDSAISQYNQQTRQVSYRIVLD